MKFSICIPVHNGEKYLYEAIMSAILQNRVADEILVLDDASTDRTALIANSSEWAGKVRYIFNSEATGFADAFNRIAKLAKGDFITILGCDDLLGVNFLKNIEMLLSESPSALLCYTGHYYIDSMGIIKGCSPEPHSITPIMYSGKDYSSRYLRGVFLGNHINRFTGVAIDRNFFLNECPLRKEAGLVADDDFFVRVGGKTDLIVGVSQPLVSVRNHTFSVTGRLYSLPLRLAEDYLFQVKFPHGHNHLDIHDVNLYKILADKFIYLLLLDGLRKNNNQLVIKSISLHKALNLEAPDFISNLSTLKRKILWAIVKDGNGMALWVYNKVFPVIRIIKKVISK
jgi:glycosyltransferase involved in cell wall biosynthesis